MLTAKLAMERVNGGENLLERREQASRSFVLQFIDLLYCRCAQVNYHSRDTSNRLRLLESLPRYAQYNLLVASPGGWAGVVHPDIEHHRELDGSWIGIQVGRGGNPVTPTDYVMNDRISHGRRGISGPLSSFLNHSFETGTLVDWVVETKGVMVAEVRSDPWDLKHLTHFCALRDTRGFTAGDYAQITQSVDLTNATHLRFQARGYRSGFNFEVYIDDRLVYFLRLGHVRNYPNIMVNLEDYVGVHTVTFKCIANTSGWFTRTALWIDNIEIIQTPAEIEYGATEVIPPTFANPNGELKIRRYFTNNTVLPITVAEVGIYAVGLDTADNSFLQLIARDVVSPPIDVLSGEILRVTYNVRITV